MLFFACCKPPQINILSHITQIRKQSHCLCFLVRNWHSQQLWSPSNYTAVWENVSLQLTLHTTSPAGIYKYAWPSSLRHSFQKGIVLPILLLPQDFFLKKYSIIPFSYTVLLRVYKWTGRVRPQSTRGVFIAAENSSYKVHSSIALAFSPNDSL